METLGQTGIVLKHFTISDLATLIEDLNYNFGQLLSNPLFKGTKGNPGDEGTDGDDGERGSKWVYVNLAKWQTQYPSLTSGSQITLSYVNAQLTADPVKVMAAMEVERIVDKDVLVLSTGIILSYNANASAFELTNASFANNGVSQSQVQQMINSAILGMNVGNKLYRFYDALAKNYVDGGSGGQNTAINPDSIYDVASSDSGPGVNMGLNHKFTALDEEALPTESDWTQIVGSTVRKYHSLVQLTQNGVGETTNEYGPGVDNPAAQVIMQATRNNGMIIGWKGENSLRNFSRIYRKEAGLVLTSHSSAQLNEYGEIVIEQTKIDLRAPVVRIMHEFQVFEAAVFESAARFKGDVTVDDLTDADIVSADNTGKLIKAWSIDRTTVSGSSSAVVASNVVASEIARLEGLIGALGGATGQDLSTILASVNDLNLRALRFVDAIFTDFNAQVTKGIRITTKLPSGANLAAGQYGFLITFHHPTNTNFIYQLYFSGTDIQFRTAIFNAGSWTFGSWSKILTTTDLNTLTGLISDLTTQVNNIYTNTLVDNDWIGRSQNGTTSLTISHKNKTVTTGAHASNSYENRLPANFIASLSLDKNHVAAVTNWGVDRGIFPQAGFIQFFYYPLLMSITQSYATIYNKFFQADGRGRLVPPEIVSGGGMSPTIDLRHYVICDGRNNTVDLGGVTLVGAGAARSNGAWGSGQTPSLNLLKSYDEWNATLSKGVLRPGSVHGEHSHPLTEAENGTHDHVHQDTIYLESTNVGYGQALTRFVGTKWNKRGSADTDADNDYEIYTMRDSQTSGNGTAHENRQASLAAFALMYVGPTS